MQRIFVVLMSALVLCGCDAFEMSESPSGRSYDKVVIFYAEGYNNLSSDIRGNIRSITKTPLPMKGSSSALLVLAHNSVSDIDYSTPTSPYLIRIYSDWSGEPVMDTLVTYEKGAFTTDKAFISDVLSYIKNEFPSPHYGLLMSSHGTGWLPERYYDRPTQRKGMPKVKSFGCEGRVEKGSTVSHETDIKDLAEAIPMKMDYIIFDACLMGCVEVAYELRNITAKIGFSQTEVLASGFDYSKFSERLLKETPANPEGFCRDYFDYYNKRSGTSRSATVSFVDCNRIGQLASVCADLIEKYDLSGVAAENVQCFFRGGHPWFYDLKDIFENAGISDYDRSVLQDALNDCVTFSAHTERFMSELTLRTNCGLSMFLPKNGSSNLRAYYKTLAWNNVTKLVN